MSVSLIPQDFIKEKYIHITKIAQLVNGLLGSNSRNLCLTCKKESCLGHTGYITLSKKIIHPLKIRRTIVDLLKICWKCKPSLEILEHIPSSELLNNVKNISKSLVCTMCNEKVQYDVSWNSKDLCFVSKRGTTVQKLTVDEVGEIFRDNVMDVIPLFPTYNSDIDSVDNVSLIKNYSNFFKLDVNPFENFQNIIGVGKKKKNYSSLSKLGSKLGMIEQEIFGKRVNYCMRSVITPNPECSIDTVIIPEEAALALGVKEGDLVLLNRQPSLIKQSILAVKVKIKSNESTISFNPCLCNAFNADFDGDEMNIFALPKSCFAEAENMLPQNNLLLFKNNQPIINVHQDCYLGLDIPKDEINSIVREMAMKKDSKALEVIKNWQTQAYKNNKHVSLTNFKQSILNIIEKGARGSKANYDAIFKSLGEQAISSRTKLYSGKHISSSFEQGLSYDEMFVHMQAVRESVASIGVTTASSGYLSKKLSSVMSNIYYDPQEGVYYIGNRIVGWRQKTE